MDRIIVSEVMHLTLRHAAIGGKIVSEKGAGTLLSVTASLQQCTHQFRHFKFVKGDKGPDLLPCTPMLYCSQAHSNAQLNKLLKTMADWYRDADSTKKVVGFCSFVIQSSLAKLFVARCRLKSRVKAYKIASRNLSRMLIERSNNSVPEYSDLSRIGLLMHLSLLLTRH